MPSLHPSICLDTVRCILELVYQDRVYLPAGAWLHLPSLEIY